MAKARAFEPNALHRASDEQGSPPDPVSWQTPHPGIEGREHELKAKREGGDPKKKRRLTAERAKSKAEGQLTMMVARGDIHPSSTAKRASHADERKPVFPAPLEARPGASFLALGR